MLLLTLSSLSRHAHWLVRFGDFPRLQIIKVLLLALFANILLPGPVSIFDRLFTFELLLCLIYQLSWILPLTILFPKESADAAEYSPAGLRVLIFNILMQNRNSAEVLECVQKINPDVILFSEPDQWWSEQLSGLNKTYPYSVSHPLGNCFGMMLFSRLELVDAELQFLVQPDIPSIHTKLKLKGGAEIAFHGLHPRPPSPTDEGRSTTRDAELLLVAQAVAETNIPTIVAGDLNDVPWSRTALLFKKIGGLLDPRIGRGFYNSFHTKNPLCRFPLDHIFHTCHFRIGQITRVKNSCGSDHFPIYVDLSLDEAAPIRKYKPTVSESRRADFLIGKAFAFEEGGGLTDQINLLKTRILRNS